MTSVLKEDGGLLVLGNLRQATKVHICMTERDARALWRVYGHKKKALAIIAAPYPDELQHVEIPARAKVYAWRPNEVRRPKIIKAMRPKSLAFMSQHRDVIARAWRGWEFTRLPGFNWLGEPDKPLSAFCAAKRIRKYWAFRLEYDELDTCVPLDGVFAHILDTCGPPEAALTDELWNRHEESLSRRAVFTPSDWKWWGGSGLSRAMVEELRALLIDRYAKAQAIIATYVPDPQWLGSLMPPAGWPKDEQL